MANITAKVLLVICAEGQKMLDDISASYIV